MMKGGMAGLMKQAQQMQEKMAQMQEELANAEVTGEAGGGMVSLVMTGRHDVKRVTIDPSLLKGMSEDDREMLEAVIASAVNSAVQKIEKNSKEKMGNMTAGMNLPAGMKLPF
ncbi:YbaB/EbfC family nucleoid-associated protein [Pseudomonas germanica]|uniref:YbaB/EbfC family nucleoid-associated protein n=1 Tax=Pseudomonas germanica TaxID=2815720 RepID=UPI002A4E14AE|nr:YbaB/EbfC family nucleoid-associated protein [Pseudomonas germanica]WPN76567.1 YbaB/EbfC family nucleoid-associated protein [Pseudomonas germanica]